MTTPDAEAVVRLWCDIFQHDSAATVGMAVKAFISEDKSGFPPTPGQILAKMPATARALIGRTASDQKWAEYQRRYAELMELRRAAGLPAGWGEAKERGLTASEYAKICDEAGLSVGGILEEIYGS